MPAPLISPSILSADFARLGEEVRAIDAAGADWIHIDVMDGHFVPNITIGPEVIKALRPHSAKPFDVHLMIAPVDPYLTAFAEAGADIITIHPEAGPHIHRSLQAIKALGKKAGVVLNPGTPVEVLDNLMDLADLILVMSVNPGFGGQAFIPSQLEKIARIRSMITRSGRAIHLEVDGGVNAETARMCIEAGADVLVAGSASFKGGPERYAANIAALKGSSLMASVLRPPAAARAEALVTRAAEREALVLPGGAEPGVADVAAASPATLTAAPPARALALSEAIAVRSGPGEALIRLAYRLGIPGHALAQPFRRAQPVRVVATVESPNRGERTAGIALRAGHFLINGVRLPIASFDFSPAARHAPAVERVVHSFAWLADLAAAAPRPEGVPVAERIAKAWLSAQREVGKGPAWETELAGLRLVNWLVHAPLLLGGTDKTLKTRLLAAIAETATWLDKRAPREGAGLGAVAAWAGVVAAGLLLPQGRPRRLYGEAGLIKALGDMVGEDGGVLARCPAAQLEAIRLLTDLIACYAAVNLTPPAALAAIRELLVPPLLALRHGDGGLGSWQGQGAISAERVSAIIAASGVRTRPLAVPETWGYARVKAGETLLQFDTAPPPPAHHTRVGCASTLAFELSDGPARVIVNCGGAALAGGQVPARIGQALRTTAAFSTLVLDNANSTAVLLHGRLGKGVETVTLARRALGSERRGATRIEAAHDGYAARFGLTHQRILTLSGDGTELVGEDLLIPTSKNGKRGKIGFAIRFHLGRGVEVQLSGDRRGASLLLPDGRLWQFRLGGDRAGASEITLAIEDSLWVDGEGRPHATEQLVIEGMAWRSGGHFSWLLKKTG